MARPSQDNGYEVFVLKDGQPIDAPAPVILDMMTIGAETGPLDISQGGKPAG